jgi:hypothetical protein
MNLEYNTWINYNRIVKAIINQAIKDASGDIKSSDWRKRSSPDRMIREAKRFIRSSWCHELCDMVDMDYERILVYGQKTKNADRTINEAGSI